MTTMAIGAQEASLWGESGTRDAGVESDREVFETAEQIAELYARHASRLRAMVSAAVTAPEVVIEDACAFAWYRLINNRARVRRDTAPAWLVSTARHEASKIIRRARRAYSIEALTEEVSWLESDADPVELEAPVAMEDIVELRSRLDSLTALPKRQQRCVWLQGFGLSYDEIAAVTGLSPRSVERQLSKARRALVAADAG